MRTLRSIIEVVAASLGVLATAAVALADLQVISLASGRMNPGGRGRDASLRAAVPPALGLVGGLASSDFVAARSGAAAYVPIASARPASWGAPPISTAWVTATADGTTLGTAALYAMSFTVEADALTDRWAGTLEISFLADAMLGQAGLGGVAVREGVYINEIPIASSLGGSRGTIENRSYEIPVGVIRPGTNWLYVYVDGPLPNTFPSRPSGVCLLATVTARPLTVGPLPSAGFGSISAAVAASEDGDVIHVLPGIYTEDLRIDGRSVTLRSTGGADQTIVRNATSGFPALLVGSGVDGPGGFAVGEVTVEGFTFAQIDELPLGQAVFALGSHLTMRRCRIAPAQDNYAVMASVLPHADARVQIENSLIAQFPGSGVAAFWVRVDAPWYSRRSEIALTGCTVVGSGVTALGTGTPAVPTSPFLFIQANTIPPTAGSSTPRGTGIFRAQNSIFRGFAEGDGGAAGIFREVNQPLTSRLVTTIRQCNIPGGVSGAWSGLGNFDTDPQFVAPGGGGGVEQIGDYRLLVSSPCIDAGSVALEAGRLDLAGSPRTVAAVSGSGAARPDVGAFEFTPRVCEADFNADGNLDPDDLGDFINLYFGGCE